MSKSERRRVAKYIKPLLKLRLQDVYFAIESMPTRRLLALKNAMLLTSETNCSWLVFGFSRDFFSLVSCTYQSRRGKKLLYPF